MSFLLMGAMTRQHPQQEGGLRNYGPQIQPPKENRKWFDLWRPNRRIGWFWKNTLLGETISNSEFARTRIAISPDIVNTKLCFVSLLMVKELLVFGVFHMVAKEIGGFQLFKEPLLGAGPDSCNQLYKLKGVVKRCVLFYHGCMLPETPLNMFHVANFHFKRTLAVLVLVNVPTHVRSLWEWTWQH